MSEGMWNAAAVSFGEVARLDPDVRAGLVRFESGARSVLGNDLVAIYIAGSLAWGGFDRDSSDIDFVAVTRSPLTDTQVAALGVMHEDLHHGGGTWLERLEGAYIPLASIRVYNPNDPPHPTLSFYGGFEREHHDAEWIVHRQTVRERGIVVVGPNPKTIISPISQETLKRAMLDSIPYERLRDGVGERPREYQAIDVLTICRMLYTFTTGKIATKQAAAQWAVSHLDPQWAPTIQQALAWRADPTPAPVDGTRTFVAYGIASLTKAKALAEQGRTYGREGVA